MAQIPCTLSGASARRLCLAKRWFSRHLTRFALLCSLLGVNHQRATTIHPWQNACLHSSCHFTVFSFEFEAILIFGQCVHQAVGSTFWELAEIWTHLFHEHHWLSGWLIGQQVLSIKNVLMSQNCTTSCKWKCISHFLFWLHFNLISTWFWRNKVLLYLIFLTGNMSKGIGINIVMKSTTMVNGK